MIAPRFAVAMLLCTLASGCTTLKNSIQQRISVSEQCRIATAAVPQQWDSTAPIASIHLGNIGTCSLSGEEKLLPMCSLAQIGGKYGLMPVLAEPVPTTQQEIEARLNPELRNFRAALGTLRGEFDLLATLISALDTKYRDGLKALKANNYAARIATLKTSEVEIQKIAVQLARVRSAQEVLRTEMIALGSKLHGQARIELAAWDANLRIHLAQLEQLLAGDVQLVFRSGLRDQVLTHVGRRSVELLHSALKPADVVLNKLDDKAYGAVSIGYLAFGPNIQGAVNNAVDDLKAAYSKRHGQTASSDDLKIFLREVRRAACDNLVQGDQFTMLTELVDTMLITQISESDPILDKPKADTDTKPAEGADVARLSLTEATRQNITKAATESESAMRSASGGGVLNIYKANEWMARQQLLVQKLSAKAESTSPSTAPNHSFPDIAIVDEAAVKELAEAATATVVDDITRVDPAMLNGVKLNNSALLTSHVPVVAAAAAVSRASANLKLNLSVSNINTFNPSNHNAPVFNLPPQQAPASADRPPGLCDVLTIAAHGAECSEEPGGPAITFTARTFQSDSCNPADLEPTLSAVGRTLAAYRARYGIQMDAVVHGFASLPAAKLAKCPAAQKALDRNCRYANRLRATFDIEYCPAATDRNVTLSAARASRAAAVLEQAAQGAVTVTSVVARGADAAQLGLRPAAAEQTVAIQLVIRK